QLAEMYSSGVRLVVPAPYLKSFPPEHRDAIYTLDKFIAEVQAKTRMEERVRLSPSNPMYRLRFLCPWDSYVRSILILRFRVKTGFLFLVIHPPLGDKARRGSSIVRVSVSVMKKGNHQPLSNLATKHTIRLSELLRLCNYKELKKTQLLLLCQG